jgi:hypothetical protein
MERKKNHMFFKNRISFTHFGKTNNIPTLYVMTTTLRKYLTPHGRQLPEIETASGGSARHEEGANCGTNSVGLAASHLQSPAGLWRFWPSPSGSLLLPKHSIKNVE